MQDGKHVVLYVDDDQDFLDSMRVILESNHYVMVEANSAEQGLKVYKESRPDLIIVDLMMEEVDAGTHFVKELQALGNKAPIYMLSSVGDSMSMSTDYSQLGLNGVLQKPINPDALLAILRTKLK
ncbi:MAG: response regulator [Phycisphaerales bacterium]|nr:response regulator [Phycisphaerales bacterium]